MRTAHTPARTFTRGLELLRLSGPVIIARAGLLMMALVDTVVVGHYAAEELARLALAHAITGTLMVTGAGLLIGVLVMTAQAAGRGEPEAGGAAWQRGLLYGGALGVVGLLPCLAAEPQLLALGQDAKLAGQTAEVMLILGLGLPAALVYVASAFFLEGLARPRVGMIAMILANLLNALANYCLVYGHWGFPEWGAVGSAWATTAVRIFLAVSMFAYVRWLMPDRATFAVSRWPGWKWSEWAQQRAIGYGGGLSFAIEATAFMVLSLIAGLIGPLQVAATAIVVNVRSLLFMIPLGIGFATSVKVGMAAGRQDFAEVRLSAWTGMVLGLAVIAPCAAAVAAQPEVLAHFYTNDAHLAGVVVPLFLLLAVILPLDSGQGVMANALRGRGDSMMPTICHGVAYLVVMAPLAWFLALGQQRSVTGLFEALLVGTFVAAAMLSLRFQWLGRQDGA